MSEGGSEETPQSPPPKQERIDRRDFLKRALGAAAGVAALGAGTVAIGEGAQSADRLRQQLYEARCALVNAHAALEGYDGSLPLKPFSAYRREVLDNLGRRDGVIIADLLNIVKDADGNLAVQFIWERKRGAAAARKPRIEGELVEIPLSQISWVDNSNMVEKQPAANRVFIDAAKLARSDVPDIGAFMIFASLSSLRRNREPDPKAMIEGRPGQSLHPYLENLDLMVNPEVIAAAREIAKDAGLPEKMAPSRTAPPPEKAKEPPLIRAEPV